jgi:hypothetical protein
MSVCASTCLFSAADGWSVAVSSEPPRGVQGTSVQSDATETPGLHLLSVLVSRHLHQPYCNLSLLPCTLQARFRSASCTLVTAADAHVFQAGAENVTYDGPLRLR